MAQHYSRNGKPCSQKEYEEFRGMKVATVSKEELAEVPKPKKAVAEKAKPTPIKEIKDGKLR